MLTLPSSTGSNQPHFDDRITHRQDEYMGKRVACQAKKRAEKRAEKS
jgi:hypothetical protein